MTRLVSVRKRPRAEERVEDEPRPRRALTDELVEMVQYAQAHPGRWVQVPRTFKTRENAQSTASCVRRGFLRVNPQPDEPTYELNGKVYLALPAAPAAKAEQHGGVWRLSLRADQT